MATESASSTAGNPLIVVDQLSKLIVRRDSSRYILDSVSFAVPQTAMFCIVGPSGSGKSALLRMLTGLDRPTSGRVTVARQQLLEMTANDLARWRGRNVGIVFRSSCLISTLTVHENIVLALELGRKVPNRDWRDRATSALRDAGIAPFATNLPTELSRELQQRAAIARALVNDPLLLVADEPTGDLSSGAAARVFELVSRLPPRGTTVVYATHDRDLAALATDRVELIDGHIVSQTYGAIPGIYQP